MVRIHYGVLDTTPYAYTRTIYLTPPPTLIPEPAYSRNFTVLSSVLHLDKKHYFSSLAPLKLARYFPTLLEGDAQNTTIREPVRLTLCSFWEFCDLFGASQTRSGSDLQVTVKVKDLRRRLKSKAWRQRTRAMYLGLLYETNESLREKAKAAVFDAKVIAVWEWSDHLSSGNPRGSSVLSPCPPRTPPLCARGR